MKNKSTTHKRNLAGFFELGLNLESAKSYIQSYPHLLAFFRGIDEIKSTDFVCAAHMAYGWMPTILTLKPETPGNFDYEASLLNRARQGDDLIGFELKRLADTINNSLVGASKVLHFAAPDHYAIWDSKVFAFLNSKTPLGMRVARPSQKRLQRIDLFQNYQNLLREISNRPGFADFHQRVNAAVGPVSRLRAIELVMFVNSPPFKNKEKA
jgi:hypothetical protein